MSEFNRTVAALHTLRNQMAAKEPDPAQLRQTATELRAASGNSEAVLPSGMAASIATGANRCQPTMFECLPA